MSGLSNLIEPWGRTQQRTFWVISGICWIIWLLVAALNSHTNANVAVPMLVLSGLFLFLHTVRRLHDAGHSRWWILLALFPISITIDAGQLDFGYIQFHIVNITDLIRSAPFIAALVLPSKLQR